MSLFDYVKKALRITTNAYDNEITECVNQAIEDLARSGILNESEMFRRAVVTYVRANFGDDENADRFSAAFETIKARLAVTDENL